MARFDVQSLIALCALAAAVVAWPAAAEAQGTFHEDFEGAETSWQITAADARHEVQRHQRVRTPAYAGAWSEALTVQASDGTFIHFSRSIRARVIDELNLSLVVLSDRPGMQLLARAVLPRCPDPKTGRPLTLLLYGTSYEKAGQWQQLVLGRVPQQLERQARIMQSGRAEQIDLHEAYIDAVMLNVYGGRGVTQVYLDELAAAGCVDQVAGLRVVDRNVQPAAGAEEASRPAHTIALRGAILSIDGRPFFPRVIEHRGEPLAKLRQLGFNSVKLAAAADGALLAEAADAGVWLIAPPPQLAAGARIGRAYDPVLAWSVGDALSQRELPETEAAIRALREADRDVRRPIMLSAAGELAAYSELADVMLMGRQALGTSLELSDYATWQQQRMKLMRPGAPAWSWIQTQCDAACAGQAAALASQDNRANSPEARVQSQPPTLPNVHFSALRQLALMAVASGARGLVFESQTPLDGNGPEAEYRLASLKLLNLELSLIENWAAAGSFVTPATSSDPAINAVVLQTERARLLLPLRYARGDQYVLDEGPGGDVNYVVPGVPESNDVFELTAAGLRPLLHRRVTGGMSVTLRDAPPAALVVLTQDAQIINALTRGAAQQRRSAAELGRRLAGDELAEVQDVSRRLADTVRGNDIQSWISGANARLQQVDANVAAEDYPRSLALCRQAQHLLGRARRASWAQSVAALPSPVALPPATRFATLPQCAALQQSLASASGENALSGGDFEDLESLRRIGWRHTQLVQRRVASNVELSADGPHGGRHCLRLHSVPQLEAQPPSLLEGPPAWVSSPPLALAPGSIVEIRGFVRVPRPIVGSVDGLLIVDSLGGDALAERVGQTRGWQPFTLYRAAPRGGSLTVTFALSGIGEAMIDDVTIRTLTPTATSPAAAAQATILWR